MTKLSQNLYITYSNQKARDLKSSSITQPLDKVIALDTFIRELFEANNFAIIIDETIGRSIIYHIIQTQKIEYFDYLSEDATSLSTIYDFLIKCNRHNMSIQELIQGKRLDAMKAINSTYQEYKQEKNLADLADIEHSVLNNFEHYFNEQYETIFIDDFKVGDIDFLSSNLQKEILAKIPNAQSIHKQATQTSNIKLIKPFINVFDNIDEVKTAIKIARKLLQDGAKSDEILIVASDINEYAPLYKLFLDEYGLKGYSSRGTPLSSFHNRSDPKVQQALQGYLSQIRSLEILYKKLGLTLGNETKEQIKASVIVPDDKVGIEMTEPNQLVGLSKHYKHIIFIGTDINHFPPQAKDNFLYSYEQDVQYFKANNYFTSSQTQLEELKRLSENLYIITASYNGKRELSRSILIGDHFDESIDLSDIKSINDLALCHQTVVQDDAMKSYFESITSENFTKYDGLGVKGIQATHLSASQINSYTTCPLRYLYSNKIRLQAPSQSEEGFDVMEQGTLMHKCYELFGRKIKSDSIRSTERDMLYNLMYEISIQAYNDPEIVASRGEENIHHKIFLSTLQAGLRDEREAGLLAKFVDYYIDNAKDFDYFVQTEFEKEFLLDDNLKPYEQKNDNDDGYFIRGFIDRFDNLDDKVNIIDYKSKKIKTKSGKHPKTQEKIDTLKDVQLALYLLYAQQKYPDKKLYASLLSFKGDSAAAHFGELEHEDFTEEYKEKLKSIVFDTKESIEKGEFAFDNSDEQTCGWCDFRFICHESVLNKLQ